MTETPWLITEDALASLHEAAAAPFIPGFAYPAAEVPTPELRDGLLTIPIHGTLLRRVSPSMRDRMAYYGESVALMPELDAALHEARTNPDVHTVLLDVDSPGGSVNGTSELAHSVRELAREKHVYAFTAGQASSAAYWIASQSDGIYMAPSARVGSIGVLLPLVDTSAAFGKAGLRMDVISAGKYKSAGLGGTSLTEEQRALLQDQVDAIWRQFKEAATARRSIADEDMEGQSFQGEIAISKGLADAFAYSLAEVRAKLVRRHAMEELVSPT